MTPIWISQRLAQAIHDAQIDRNGGSHGTRDENLFLSSLARPRNLLIYAEAPTIFDLAAAYGYGIAKNHPFIDGNKRTGLVLMAVFLELNGYFLDTLNEEVVYMVVRLTTDLENQESISTWLQAKSVKSKQNL